MSYGIPAGSYKSYTAATLHSESSGLSNADKTDLIISKYFPEVAGTGKENPDFEDIHPTYANFMSCVILLNCLQIGAECQWTREQSMMAPIYTALDVVFCTLYVTEIAFKWWKLGVQHFFCAPAHFSWNVVDLVLTILMAGELFAEHICSIKKAHHIARQFHLLRFVRMFRILRILHSIPELSLLLEGLIASWSRLTWIVSLLMLLIYIFGIFFTIEIDDGIFEKRYFQDLASSMSTLLNVIIGAEWMEVADPILDRQPHLMLPLLGFLIVGSFGILNCIVGVIVDATADSKEAFLKSDKLKQLKELSDIWLVKTTQAIERSQSGGRLHRSMTVELEAKERQRKELILGVLEEVIMSKTVKFPAGTTAKELYHVIDEDGSGELSHEEFIIGLGHLLLADSFQLSCGQSMSLAKVRRMAQRAEASRDTFQESVLSFQEEMLERTSRLESQLAKLAK